MKKNNPKEKKDMNIAKRLRITMLVIFFLLFLLLIRLAWLQFVQGSELKEAMYNQLVKSTVISPKRGTIYDTTRKSSCH